MLNHLITPGFTNRFIGRLVKVFLSVHYKKQNLIPNFCWQCGIWELKLIGICLKLISIVPNANYIKLNFSLMLNKIYSHSLFFSNAKFDCRSFRWLPSKKCMLCHSGMHAARLKPSYCTISVISRTLPHYQGRSCRNHYNLQELNLFLLSDWYFFACFRLW